MSDIKINKRADLLRVALTLFSERGYNGTSVQEIVNLAGVTKPSLYYFFKNKQGIYAALWDEYFIPFYKTLQTIAVYEPNPQNYKKDVFPQLCKIADQYYAFSKAYPVFYRLMLSLQFSPEDAEGIKEIQVVYKAQFKVIKNLFDSVAMYHGNLQGKTDLLSKIFVADVYSGIEEKIETKEIVKLFMHGIF